MARAEQGMVVSQFTCAIGREEGGRENLAKLGCTLASTFTWQELSDAKEPS